jgi:CRISPR-associated exonuclease Cas4
MEGRLMHEAVDSGTGERRAGVRIARGITLHSFRYGLAGRADAVEFREHPARAYPVEYKRGKPKSHRADEVQLCAQALCLEEMLGLEVVEGAIFYGVNRRRLPVRFDAELRALTTRVTRDVRAMLRSARTPAAKHTPACRRCSLVSLCQPKTFEAPPRVDAWFARRLEHSLESDT